MTAAEIAEIEESRQLAMRSPIWWFGTYARIPDKKKKLIRPKPNIFQIRMCMAYEWCVQMGIPPRLIGCKPRQVGGTTIAAALGYHHMRRISADAIAIADIKERSHKLFQMYERYKTNDTFDWGQQDAPGTQDLLHIGNSNLEKKTAENPTASRASTLQFIHKSEVAFWPRTEARDAVETDTALMGSLAKHKDTLCIDESTPKGSSGLFADRWLAAKWPTFDRYWEKYAKRQQDGDSDWIRVFAAWFEFEEYASPVTEEEKRVIEATLTPREKSGIQTYGWTVQQVAWRRYTIVTECSNSETKFDEEYPEDPVKCFAASGSPRFEVAGMDYLQSLAEATPFKTGLLSDIDPVRGGRPSFSPIDPANSWVKLWELPKEGCRYFIGGDVAEDKDMNPAKASTEVKRDRHSFFCLRAGFADNRGVRWRPRVVGRIVPPCRWGHDLLAKRLHLMSVFFGGCPIAPEMNNHGLALAKELKRLEANLFSQTIVDPLNNRELRLYGHRTGDNRADVIEKLAKSIRNALPKFDELSEAGIVDPDSLEILDVDAIAQLRTFVIDRNGRAAGAPGCHDDDVMGLAITWYLLGSATAYTEKIVERVIPKWDYQVVGDNKPRPSITGS